MNRYLLSVLFFLPLFAISQSQKLPEIISPKFKKDSLSITAFGAKPDGLHLNTKSIAATIDALAGKGGGVVVIPAGLWLTGPVELKSGINLYLATGATLLFTPDKSQYPLVKANWEGLPQMRNQSPISATNATNIAITGNGVIDGNGDVWRMVKKDKLNESQWKKLVSSGGVVGEDKKTWHPSEQFLAASKLSNPGQILPGRDSAYYASIKDFLRPNLLLLTNCKYILLEGVTFQNSPAWCLHPLMSQHMTVRNIKVKNPWYAQNGDGIDVESCSNVLIENSVFDVGDDALCIKSGRDAEGRKRAMPTENVIIRDCIVYASHGGFVIGSEMSGGARNIHVSNCTFVGADIGLRFKTTRGRGGVVENIFIRDIYMKDIPGEAILFDMYYAARDPIPLVGEKRELPPVEFKPVDETTPVFRNFNISNVYVNGAEKGVFIRGLPEMHVRDIVLENMVIQAKKGIDIQEATGITFRNVNVISRETDPVIDIVHSDKLVFDNISYANGSELLFRVSGDRSSNISIINTDPAKSRKKINYELGATGNSTSFGSPISLRNDAAWSEKLSATAMSIWPDSFTLEGDKIAKWRYDQGVILKGMEQVWLATGNGTYFNYIRKAMDFYVNESGTIKGYRPDEYNIDHINNGKVLLMLYEVTGKEKYKKAADHLRNQLRAHPRTSEGGFWHKNIYPSQMWLDGLFMAQPFYAEYAKLFHDDTAFNDIANQFILMEKNALDKKTGLLYHGWDESRAQQWADKTTGQSPHFWSRSLGWFGMALVDVLDHFPADHPKRKELIAILNRFASATRKVQDPESGVWYDIPNLPAAQKNYKEASASAMLAYTYAKGARKNYLPAVFREHAKKAYAGILKEFIEVTPSGQVNLKGTVAVSGLGGKPYRDGSYEYYMSEPVITNDPKGMGAFILCAAEMERLEKINFAKGKTVLLDYFFNNEWKKDITGTSTRWHYTWEDRANSGYSVLGNIFQKHGAETKRLEHAPDAASLKNANVYIIVDPDTDKETATPNFINEPHINAIAKWVQAGGVLVLMGNDAGNSEFANFNRLSARFGIKFIEDSKNRVKNDQFEQGAVHTQRGPVFSKPWKLFIKEYSSLEIKTPASAIIKNGNDIVMAATAFGKGKVIAIGDPWIYNEYIDGRKLPAEYENYAAAEEWIRYLLK